MASLVPMDRKAKKKFISLLEENFGFSGELPYQFILSDKNKVYLVNPEISSIPFENIRMNSLGLYFGEWDGSEIRLSIEGSQLIGPGAAKNVVETKEGDARKWLKGENLPLDGPRTGFVIVKCGDDYLGSGKAKERAILNFVPKARRLYVSD